MKFITQVKKGRNNNNNNNCNGTKGVSFVACPLTIDNNKNAEYKLKRKGEKEAKEKKMRVVNKCN